MSSTLATGSVTSSATPSTGDPMDGRHAGWTGQGNRRRVRGQIHAAMVVLEEGAAEKHMAQLQHNMLVAGTRKSVLSIINGGGKWIELSIEADPIYQTILIAAEKGFLAAVKTARPDVVRLRASKTTDRSGPRGRHERLQLLGRIRRTIFARPKTLTPTMSAPRASSKGLMPEDAKEAMGHGIRAKRSKSGAVSFDLVEMEVGHASVQ